MPAAQALSSSSGEAAEDNVVEREKILVAGGITDNGITDYVTDGQTDVEFEIVWVIKNGTYSKIDFY